MRTVEMLIDECITKCESQSALARRIGIKPQDVQAMASGKRPISPATVAMLCDVLKLPGEEAQRLAALAVIGNAPPEKRGVLRRAFFALSLAGAACGLTAMPTGNAQAKSGTARIDSLYIVAHWLRWLAVKVRARNVLDGCHPSLRGVPMQYAFQ